MKPVVSSLVALAIAIAPLTAMAAEKSTHGKAASSKVVKHKKADKAEPKAPMIQVKHVEKKGHKPAKHHAHSADMSGAGHSEPKVDGAVIPASLTTKGSHGKTAHMKTVSAHKP